MRGPHTAPAVGRRLAIAGYARSHNKSQAARHFGCCWATIQTDVRQALTVHDNAKEIAGGLVLQP
jgi:hypothetical protein